MSNITRKFYRNPLSQLYVDSEDLKKQNKHRRAKSGVSKIKRVHGVALRDRIFDTSPERKPWQDSYRNKPILARPPIIEGRFAIFSNGSKYYIMPTGNYVRTQA